MERVIITWGSEGLWLELAKLFLEKWFEVICLSRRKPEIDVVHIQTDLSEKKSIQASIATIKKKFSKFKYLINCAAVLHVEPTAEIEYDTLENMMRINLMAPIMLISQLLDLIKENESDIVNVWSTGWYKPKRCQYGYGVSKRWIRWVSANLQLRLEDTKCRVIWFNPWSLKTKMYEKAAWSKRDPDKEMDAKEVAKFMIQILELPKNMEVSEIIINRK